MAQTTKNALAASLKKMVAKKTLDNITVKDIVEDCGVRRQTFYYHFHDIFELIEWIYITEIAKAIEDNKTHSTWNQGFLQLFQYILDNKAFVLNTCRSVNREELEKNIYEGSYFLLYGVVEEQSVGLNVSEEDKKFVADFYKYSFACTLLDWINKGMKEDPKVIIEHIDVLITGNIRRYLLHYNRE